MRNLSIVIDDVITILGNNEPVLKSQLTSFQHQFNVKTIYYAPEQDISYYWDQFINILSNYPNKSFHEGPKGQAISHLIAGNYQDESIDCYVLHSNNNSK